EVFINNAADFVAWAKQTEAGLRGIVVGKIISGEYRCVTDTVTAPGNSNRAITKSTLLEMLRPSLLIFFPCGSSSWEYKCDDIYGAQEVNFMLDKDRKLDSPVNLSS